VGRGTEFKIVKKYKENNYLVLEVKSLAKGL
jgi:hypothetical protein